jgi:class 3 adenylate cyclase
MSSVSWRVQQQQQGPAGGDGNTLRARSTRAALTSGGSSGIELASASAENNANMRTTPISIRSESTLSRKSDEYWEMNNEEFDLKQAVAYYLKAHRERQQREEEHEGIHSQSNSSAPMHSLSRTGFFSTMHRSQTHRHNQSNADSAAIDKDPSFSLSRLDYKKQAWWNGLLLHFKTMSIDLAFMNEFSVLHKKAVLVGYALEIVLASVIMGLDQIFFLFEKRLCDVDDDGTTVKFYCDTLFGPRGNDELNKFNTIFGLSLLALVILGVGGHCYIHGRKRIQNKAWALAVVFTIYLVEIVLLLTLIILLHKGDNFWPLKLMVWYMLIVGLSIWFTGFLFVQNLITFIVAACYYFPATVNVAAEKELNSLDPVVAKLDSILTASLYQTTSHFILFIHIAMLVASYMNERTSRKRFFQRLMITSQQDKIIHQKTKYGKLQKDLLFNMLPPTVVNQLEMQGYGTTGEQLQVISERHQGVCILFADIVQFTQFATLADPPSVMVFLNDVFESLDNLCDLYNVYKVETVANSYVAAVGIVSGSIVNRKVSLQKFNEGSLSDSQRDEPINQELDASFDESSPTAFLYEAAAENTAEMIGFAKAIVREAQHVIQPVLDTPTVLRIGVHTGPCMSGIVGSKNLKFCLFGDTMNTAARMQQNGLPNIITASEIVQRLTPEEKWLDRGQIEMKGKGYVRCYKLVVNDT